MLQPKPDLSALLNDVRACRICEDKLPFAPNPVLRAGPSARLLIIGQAPGTKVQATGIPWNDASGDRLRRWLALDKETFYDEKRIAIIPMGFCYPGKGASGDLPPRPECAPHWHAKLLSHLPQLTLTLLIGQYAQAYYLLDKRKETLTETVKAWREYLPLGLIPLVHPSPRNTAWLSRNPWFERELAREIKARVHALL